MTHLLADHTTLHLGGPAADWVEATTIEELTEAAADRSALILGGGSNLVIADEGVPGTVVHVATRGITPDVTTDDPTCGGVMLTVAAGETLDDLVARAVAEGWTGLEALSGIPGSVGATPIQNVGAYGAEVAQTVAQVRVWDRVLKGFRTFAAADCQFTYRNSRFKADPGRHVVVEVVFQLRQGTLSAPIAYAELASKLGVTVGERVPLADVRAAVLELRGSKGMVLDPADHDTWSAGSFFTNPIIEPEALPAGAPTYDQGDGTVKTSAAWLIQAAGFSKGYGNARVSVSTKHTLALTNRGGATTAELLSLAREIRDGVEREFGIELVPEPVLLGTEL
ncbi:UDP-N-acetylmuramate dehydrogenase [Nocardioides sp. Kera G14]|uniref:UDP-N-acetylmuramate dehydrogenase n=1 Tax=Nocardioides sp. Kera G14 TaxID=2884264 RepID=UPI001D11089E|nr:UDP-N-acetylmuramate dehydrogenase [Nocardioides sp. Kera G14]UDY23950.1 UDP-N-acetylmuramate dehydrogenase [Nocardioides sp. Kera G14]